MPIITNVPTRHAAEYRAERLEEERARLSRRIGWALRRKDAEKAERLGRQLASVEQELARSTHRRRPEWPPAVAMMGV